MQERIRYDHPLRRMFAGLVEDRFFTRLGIADPSLADYLVELLIGFVHMDGVFAIRDESGRRLEQVAEMMAAVEPPSGRTDTPYRRLVHRHIGDYSLFWSGIYPESLGRLRRVNAADGLLDYRQTGKRSYAIASELSSERTRPPARLLRRLSEEFESCVWGLTLVRQGWEERDPTGLAAARSLWT